MMPEDKMLLAAAIICAASYLRDQSTTDRVCICCLRVCVSTCASDDMAASYGRVLLCGTRELYLVTSVGGLNVPGVGAVPVA